jgi:hypothetical protein
MAQDGRLRGSDHRTRGGVGPERREIVDRGADAYLASFDDLTGTAARRADLVSALRASLPNTALADK